MFTLVYDPKTKVYRITENGLSREGKFNIYQVFKILHDYVLKMSGV